jgi:hypothetical protein
LVKNLNKKKEFGMDNPFFLYMCSVMILVMPIAGWAKKKYVRRHTSGAWGNFTPPHEIDVRHYTLLAHGTLVSLMYMLGSIFVFKGQELFASLVVSGLILIILGILLASKH